MSKDDIPIDDNNLHDFKLKDIIQYKDRKKIIKLFERDFYNRIRVIDQLRKLEKDAENNITIDWYKQREFFERIDELAGKDIANIIKNDLLRVNAPTNNDESPGNDNEENRKKSDKEYIKEYLKCLLEPKNSSSAPIS